MSIGQDAIQAPQYIQRFLFTTSWMRLPKILSLIGRAFHPSPSTVDLRGVVWGTARGDGGFGAGCADICLFLLLRHLRRAPGRIDAGHVLVVLLHRRLAKPLRTPRQTI